MEQIRLIMLVESRIRGDVYVRFGGEYLKTYHSNMIRRWMLSLLLMMMFLRLNSLLRENLSVELKKLDFYFNICH